MGRVGPATQFASRYVPSFNAAQAGALRDSADYLYRLTEDPFLLAVQALVARGQVERDPTCPSVEEEGGARRLDTAEIVEGVGLPRELEAVCERGPLDDGHGLLANGVEDPTPSGPELLGREISLVVLSVRCGRGPEHQYEGGPQTAE